MPPFVSPMCPHCKKKNRFDLAELNKNPGTGMVYRGSAIDVHDFFIVTCRECGQQFKITVKLEDDDKANDK